MIARQPQMLQMSAVETGQMSALATEDMSAVETGPMSAETGQMSAVETRQMSAAETGQMFAVETRQMSTIATGRRPVLILYICLVPTADICPCLLYTSPSPRDGLLSRMPSSA